MEELEPVRSGTTPRIHSANLGFSGVSRFGLIPARPQGPIILLYRHERAGVSRTGDYVRILAVLPMPFRGRINYTAYTGDEPLLKPFPAASFRRQPLFELVYVAHCRNTAMKALFSCSSLSLSNPDNSCGAVRSSNIFYLRLIIPFFGLYIFMCPATISSFSSCKLAFFRLKTSLFRIVLRLETSSPSLVITDGCNLEGLEIFTGDKTRRLGFLLKEVVED